MTLDRTVTVARIAAAYPATARVFTRHGIPFCCHGNLSVADACSARGLDAEALLASLEEAIAAARTTAPEPDVSAMSLDALLRYLVERYHEGERRALDMVVALAAAVADEYRDRNPKLDRLRAEVDALARVLREHLDLEERSVFPALPGAAAAGSPDVALGEMTRDHGELRFALLRVRAEADDFATPPWGCGGYRTYMAELRALEADLMAHMHVEEDVLAKRFVRSPPQDASGATVRIGAPPDATARSGAR